jgi:hypothetical protein
MHSPTNSSSDIPANWWEAPKVRTAAAASFIHGERATRSIAVVNEAALIDR